MEITCILITDYGGLAFCYIWVVQEQPKSEQT